METTRPTRRQVWRSKWWMPGFSLFLGLLVLAAFWIGGDPWMGVSGLLVMGAFGSVFLH